MARANVPGHILREEKHLTRLPAGCAGAADHQICTSAIMNLGFNYNADGGVVNRFSVFLFKNYILFIAGKPRALDNGRHEDYAVDIRKTAV